MSDNKVRIMHSSSSDAAALRASMPVRRGLFYGGNRHQAQGGETETFSPGTGTSLGYVAEANAADIDAAVAAADSGFRD
jgi:betaine-aldehyde dehydrogenase